MRWIFIIQRKSCKQNGSCVMNTYRVCISPFGFLMQHQPDLEKSFLSPIMLPPQLLNMKACNTFIFFSL